jgi:non-canonical (house-cleaning) NTP pyrophosphatase
MTALPEIVCQSPDGKLLFRQSVVEPPNDELILPNILLQNFTPIPKHGENILHIIPTENEFKVKVLQDKMKAHLERIDFKGELVTHVEDFESDVGKQPYEEKGQEGACNRIRNALTWVMNNQKLLQDKCIGTVMISAIENSINRKEDPAVDYGTVIFYNATLNKTAATLSHGVTVPQVFLDMAQARGFDDDEEKCGKVTAGTVMEEVFGVDSRNWHEVVCGRSRYDILGEAVERLDVPL